MALSWIQLHVLELERTIRIKAICLDLLCLKALLLIVLGIVALCSPTHKDQVDLTSFSPSSSISLADFYKCSTWCRLSITFTKIKYHIVMCEVLWELCSLKYPWTTIYDCSHMTLWYPFLMAWSSLVLNS